MIAIQPDLKQEISSKLDGLSIDALKSILEFVEYQQFKLQHPVPDQKAPPYEPVKLGGIAPELDLSEEELDELRREMWSGLGDLNNLE